MAAAYGQLGEREAAAEAVQELLQLRPDFAAMARHEFAKWWDPEYVEHLIEGLRKAGLDVPAPAQAAAGAARPAAVAIAVLPFSDMSPAKDQEYLCEGMAEEIMNALVRHRGAFASPRGPRPSARGRDDSDLPAIARALSVSHVLEGSVRTSGDGSGSPRSSPMSRPATICGRSASTARPPTCSRCRTRSPRAWSRP